MLAHPKYKAFFAWDLHTTPKPTLCAGPRLPKGWLMVDPASNSLILKATAHLNMVKQMLHRQRNTLPRQRSSAKPDEYFFPCILRITPRL